jgi:hypothetical protein
MKVNVSDAFPPALIISALVILILGSVLVLLLFFPVPQANHDFMIYILGALSGVITAAGANKAAQFFSTKDNGQTTIAVPPEETNG